MSGYPWQRHQKTTSKARFALKRGGDGKTRSSHFDDVVEFLSVVGRRVAATRQLEQFSRQGAVIELQARRTRSDPHRCEQLLRPVTRRSPAAPVPCLRLPPSPILRRLPLTCGLKPKCSPQFNTTDANSPVDSGLAEQTHRSSAAVPPPPVDRCRRAPLLSPPPPPAPSSGLRWRREPVQQWC